MMLASLDHRQRGLEASVEKLQDAVSNIEKLLERTLDEFKAARTDVPLSVEDEAAQLLRESLD